MRMDATDDLSADSGNKHVKNRKRRHQLFDKRLANRESESAWGKSISKKCLAIAFQNGQVSILMNHPSHLGNDFRRKPLGMGCNKGKPRKTQ